MALPFSIADLQKRALDRGMWSSVHARMSARSRVTNLGVTMLACALIISLLFNLRPRTVSVRSVLPSSRTGEACPSNNYNLRNVLGTYPGSEKKPLTHLVVVAGHAIWKGDDPAKMLNDSSWFLESYQRGGSVKTFVKHIEKGVSIARDDPSSLLVFSGGQTRDQTWTTEAESYYRLALSLTHELPTFAMEDEDLTSSREAFQPLQTATNVEAQTSANKLASGSIGVDRSMDLSRLRMTTENFALDSFENLLFSIGRFYEYTGTYPRKITVVSYEFKKKRFVDLHAVALRWSTNKYLPSGTRQFNYVGIDDEDMGPSVHDNAYDLFERDMYGCFNVLLTKRRKRNSSRRLPPYRSTAPELAGLMDWCPSYGSRLQGLYPGWLPWDPRVSNGMGRGAQAFLEQNGGHFVQAEYLPDGKKIV